MREARIVCSKIKAFKADPSKRSFLINTYMIPLFSYLQRHFIMPKSITNELSVIIRKALGPYNYLPNRVLFATHGPFKLSPPVHHPFIVGLAMICATPPINPIRTDCALSKRTIAWNRMTAVDIMAKTLNLKDNGRKTLQFIVDGESYKDWKARGGGPRTLREWLGLTIPTYGPWKLIDEIPGASRDTVAVNMLILDDQRLKRSFITLFCKGWSLQHQYGLRTKQLQQNACSLCGAPQETYKHILCNCPKIDELLTSLRRVWLLCNKSNDNDWPDRGADMFAGAQPLKNHQIRLRRLILQTIKRALIESCMGILIVNRLIDNFKMVCRKKTWTRGGNKDDRTDRPPPTIVPDQTYGFFDGSACTWPPARGGGFVIYRGTQEVAAGAIHSPFQTSNWGEAKALALLMERARIMEVNDIVIYGDSEIVINFMGRQNSFQKWTQALWEQIHKGIPEGWTFKHVGREYNKRADVIANAAALSQELGNALAREQGRTTRKVTEADIEVATKNFKWYDNEVIVNASKEGRKRDTLFTIPDNYVPPNVVGTTTDAGYEEDFRELPFNESHQIRTKPIESFFVNPTTHNVGYISDGTNGEGESVTNAIAKAIAPEVSGEV